MITFEQLVHTIQPPAFFHSGKDLHGVANKLARGETNYRTQVVQPVAAGTIWSDSAQPDAVAVLTVMTRAFEAGSIQMSAGASTLATLSIELAAAKKAAQAVAAQVAAAGLYIVDGRVMAPAGSAGPANPNIDSGFPGGSSADQPQAYRAPSFQGVLDVAVQRANDADEACSALLEKVAWSDFVTGTHNEGNIVARANAAVEGAYANLDRAAKLPGQLAQQAQHNLERELKDPDSLNDVLVGIVKGLWSGVAETATLLTTLGGAALGNDAAQRKLGQIATNLSNVGLGDLINVQALKEGRLGEFIGTNLWWFVPGGGVVKGGKAAGRLGKAAGAAGKAANEAVRKLATRVPGGMGKAVHAGSLDPATQRAFLHRHYPDVGHVNYQRFEAAKPGHGTNCTRCAIATDRALAGEGPNSAMPSHVSSVEDVERVYGQHAQPVSSYDRVVHKLQQGGDGSRAIVLGERAGRPGHVINAVNDHGTVVLIDGQTGTLAHLEDFQQLYYLPTS
ncbi:MAG: toxin glutamine deamidase domain-containing protein [Streptosporangiales bacterium]